MNFRHKSLKKMTGRIEEDMHFQGKCIRKTRHIICVDFGRPRSILCVSKLELREGVGKKLTSKCHNGMTGIHYLKFVRNLVLT